MLRDPRHRTLAPRMARRLVVVLMRLDVLEEADRRLRLGGGAVAVDNMVKASEDDRDRVEELVECTESDKEDRRSREGGYNVAHRRLRQDEKSQCDSGRMNERNLEL